MGFLKSIWRYSEELPENAVLTSAILGSDSMSVATAPAPCVGSPEEPIWCFLFFSILGNYSMNLELTGQMNVSQTLTDIGHQATATKVLMTLPFGVIGGLNYFFILVEIT